MHKGCEKAAKKATKKAAKKLQIGCTWAAKRLPKKGCKKSANILQTSKPAAKKLQTNAAKRVTQNDAKMLQIDRK